MCCDILESSAVEAYDYVLSSGIHNLRLADNERTWKALVRRIFEVCRKGVGTNFLSCYTDGTMAEDSYYAQPQAVFSYCMTLTKRAVLRHDYRTNDFTVYLYK